jgi:16S rRNA G966 N2-methylase RsmD
MIEKYINVRYSTRNLTDDEFENIIDKLAFELKSINVLHFYEDKKLKSDWEKLLKTTFDKNTNSTVRVGMKLCEHFFPNFYEIKSKNKSFIELWNDEENLKKILRWNRKSHSTPYLSELKRGIYFCCGLTKSTMYRPHLAKAILSNLEGDRVIDPCCGWGGRLLGAISSNKHYTGFEPNKKTYDNLKRLVSFLNIEDKVTLYNDVIENISKYNLNKFDILLTSPPYFNLEIYCDDKRQSENLYNNYNDWSLKWLNKIIKDLSNYITDDGYMCWNVHNIGKMKIIDDVELYHNNIGYNLYDEYSLSSSNRQTNKTGKSRDVTRLYKRK